MPIARRLTLVLTALLLVAALVIYSVKLYMKVDTSDFDVYYLAATRMAQDQWQSIYSLADGTTPFRYAPVTLPFFWPLAALDAQTARMSWFYLQWVFLTGAFTMLFRAIRSAHGPDRRLDPLWATALTIILILRFCLDGFTIGQISSLMLFGYALALRGWVEDRPSVAGAGQFVPTLLKIGPGVQFALYALSGIRLAIRSAVAAGAIFAGLILLSSAWFGSFERTLELWQAWLGIVRADSEYIDASHYGSQCINSALLRLAKQGWFAKESVPFLNKTSAAAILGALFAFWGLRRPRSPLGRGLSFALGVFPYVWLMPQTFKYSLMMLAIPIAMLLASLRRDKRGDVLTRVSLGVAFVTLSIAGQDIIGNDLFSWNQHASVPLLATFLLGAATWVAAYRESDSRWGSSAMTLGIRTGAEK